ncbi:DUF1720 domain-containing protein [Nonomuraea glycinis]|uniref:DUF1720 domain-containing protein n=1 Tax=Nonomuraea glycinis TaxID=2047744 RepID=UPI00389AC48C
MAVDGGQGSSTRFREPVVEAVWEVRWWGDFEAGGLVGAVCGGDLEAGGGAGAAWLGGAGFAGGEADGEGRWVVVAGRGGLYPQVVVDGALPGVRVRGDEGQLVGDQAVGDQAQQAGGALAVGAGRAVKGDLGQREAPESSRGDAQAIPGVWLSCARAPARLRSLRVPVPPQPTGVLARPQPTGVLARPQPTGVKVRPQPTGVPARPQPTGVKVRPQPTGVPARLQPLGVPGWL